MSKIKFYSVFEYCGGDIGMTELLRDAGYQSVDNPADAQLLVFNGGADIGTEIYGENPVCPGVPHKMSARDEFEVKLYNDHPAAFKLGICRGAQLLNCLNGGSLWQDVNNHGRTHDMLDLATGKTYRTTSTHHQMMRANLLTGKVLAIAHEATSKHADFQVHPPNFAEGKHDTEIVWYPTSRTLCVQGHPEYVPGSEFANYVLSLTATLMKESTC